VLSPSMSLLPNFPLSHRMQSVASRAHDTALGQLGNQTLQATAPVDQLGDTGLLRHLINVVEIHLTRCEASATLSAPAEFYLIDQVLPLSDQALIGTHHLLSFHGAACFCSEAMAHDADDFAFCDFCLDSLDAATIMADATDLEALFKTWKMIEIHDFRNESFSTIGTWHILCFSNDQFQLSGPSDLKFFLLFSMTRTITWT
jgi:hypothetical protein